MITDKTLHLTEREANFVHMVLTELLTLPVNQVADIFDLGGSEETLRVDAAIKYIHKYIETNDVFESVLSDEGHRILLMVAMYGFEFLDYAPKSVYYVADKMAADRILDKLNSLKLKSILR